MTKRIQTFEEKNQKKPKLDDDIEALWGDWGDEIDETALEDCIKLATQRFEGNVSTQLNSTLLPSYNIFKAPEKLFSSTQLDNNILPGTSNHVPNPNKENVGTELEIEIKILRQKYEEKEGEVAILRTQLKEVKTHSSIEHQKSQGEWRKKMSITEKQVQSIRSELEFKNLEIANLKHKLMDVTKRNMNGTLNETQIKICKGNETAKDVVEEQRGKLGMEKLSIISDTVYPLNGVVTEAVFKFPNKETHIIENKLINSSRNAIPYLQNQMSSTRTVVDKSKVDIDVVLPAILKLASCTMEELNSDKSITHINKVICVCLQLVSDLQELLEQIKGYLRTEDILEADSNYLRTEIEEPVNSNCKSFDRDKMGIKSGVVLDFLAEILPYSEYLKKFICQDKPLIFLEKDILMELPCMNLTPEHGDHPFLNKLLHVLKLIGEIRKADVMTTFLGATIKLLINICSTRNYDYVTDIFCKFTKELIFLRPPLQILFQIVSLFKEASQHSSFVDYFLNKGKSGSKIKKSIVYYNSDGCRFYIFALMFDQYIFKFKTVPLDVSMGMLCFIHNTYKSAGWIHHHDIKECECLPQLYKLEIEIVFRALEKYTEEVKRTKRKTREWSYFFKNDITSKILNLMTFHSYELTEKYITVFSQYKEIENELHDDWSELEKLNIYEDIPEISCTSFDSINF